MKSRAFFLMGLLLIVSLLAAACAPVAPAPAAPAPAATPTAPPATPTAAPAAVAEFHGAWPYQVPPVGHFNRWVTNALTLGIYDSLMEQPLAMYIWADGSWMPLLGVEWEVQPPDAIVVKLRQGVKWSDGSDFTAEDVLVTYSIARLMNNVVWRYLGSVEAVDDHTVKFVMTRPSSAVLRYVLREIPIVSRNNYGEWAKKVDELVAAGKDRESEEWQALLQEFSNYRPEKQIVSGPYMIDPASITEAQLTLVKVPTAWDADQVKFDKIVLYNGETPDVTPVVMAKEVDYATHGFPPATEKAFIEQGVRIIRPPIYSGPAIYFNHDIYPLNRVEVRQAIAYAVNRDDNAVISLGESAKPPVYMAGFSDNLVPLWISEADLAKFERYQYDTAKAEQILTGIGFKRDSDGVWVDDQGKRMEYELTVPAEFADWSAAAENLAEQLTAFGIKTTVRGVTFTQHPIEVNQGKFQLAIRAWGAGNPHPHFSFVQDLFTHNYVQAAEGKGMNFPLKQTVPDLGELDLEEMVVASAEGLDEAAQKETVTKLALAFNKLLPIVPLWERYGNNPALDGVRVTGWPPEGDPIYKNSPYSDSFVIIMILDGRLHPVAK